MKPKTIVNLERITPDKTKVDKHLGIGVGVYGDEELLFKN